MPAPISQTLNIGQLRDYMAAHVPGFSGELSEEKFPGGQSNPTFKLSAGGRHYVLRRKPPGELLPSAHAVDREFRVISALANTGVPVARTHCLCEDDSIIGSMFYIMECLEGRIFWDPALPELDSNEERAAIYDEMNQVLATLHNIDADAVGLADFGKPGNYFKRQINRWTKQYRASETGQEPAMETLIEWLPTNMPENDGSSSLVHGDFRLDNLIFHPEEPRIIGVLDWELSTLGHPLADLSYQCMTWMLPHGESGIPGLGGIDRTAIGLPADKDYIAKYCERTGRDGIDNWNFYLVFCFFRLAAILQGIKKRIEIGTASGDGANSRAAMVTPLAETGVSLIG